MNNVILITGASGQVGNTATKLFAQRGWQVHPCDIPEVDITDTIAIDEIVAKVKPNVLLNCAAYTDVERAEEDLESAYKINKEAIDNLIRSCNKHDITLAHISTDYVFDGNKTAPYTEEDSPHPLNIYGASKAEGDLQIINNCTNWLILRTSWVYSSYGKNFLKTMIKIGREKALTSSPLSIVDDQIGTPTSALQIAEAAESLLSTNKTGLYNVSALGETSWCGFAKEIFSQAHIDVDVIPCKSIEYPQKATRPFYSVLSKEKLLSEGIQVVAWQDALAKEIDTMNLELNT